MTTEEYDVIVVGSGAAGMVAALTAAHQGLSAVVIEKAAHFGGSTARSGGGVWIPNNEILKRDGVTDTKEAASTYLHTLVGDVVPADQLLEKAIALAEEIAANSPRALRLTKRLLREAQHGRAGDVLELSAAFQAIVHETADHKEAVNAILEKRAPVFKGEA